MPPSDNSQSSKGAPRRPQLVVAHRNMPPTPPARNSGFGARLGFIAALIFFISSCGAFGYGLYSYWNRNADRVLTTHFTERQPARSNVELVDLTRTPIVDLGKFRYAILGLGQNSEDGRQIVWVRSFQSGRVDGYAVGEGLFGGPVKVSAISISKVALRYRGQETRIPLSLE